MKTPVHRIRKEILGLSQGELARVAGTTQSTVSRWERGEMEPDREQMAAIRKLAVERGIQWEDSWFFEPPAVLGAA